MTREEELEKAVKEACGGVKYFDELRKMPISNWLERRIKLLEHQVSELQKKQEEK